MSKRAGRRNTRLLTLSILLIGLATSLYALQRKTFLVSKATSPSSLAVEIMHYNSSGSIRNVNGFYVGDTRHYIPDVFNNFILNESTYTHSLSILDVSGRSNSFTVTYYNSSGQVAQKTYSLPANGFILMGWDAGLPSNFAGSAIVQSNYDTVVEVAIANNKNRMRGYRAIPQKKLSSTLYAPIAYQNVFSNAVTKYTGYNSTITIQNPNSFTIPAESINVKIICKDNDKPFTLKNKSPLLPGSSAYFPVVAPEHSPPNFDYTYCQSSPALSSVIFGHAEISSNYPLAANEVVVESGKTSQREEELANQLSTTLYVTSVMLGAWNGFTYSSSLNISNPNQNQANVFVSTYKANDGYATETKYRPLGPEISTGCNRELNTSIPANGEKSFFFNRAKQDGSCDWSDTWGTGENAFAFSIITSDQPIAVSQNKTNNTVEDIAELALTQEEIKSTVFIPQYFVDFLPSQGNYNTRVSVLNTGTTGGSYRFTYFDNTGKSISSNIHYIGPKKVYIPTPNLSSGKIYSLKITPED